MTNQAYRTDKVIASPTLELAPEYDRMILLLYLCLVFIGMVMVASASIGIADQQTQDPFFYAKRHFLRRPANDEIHVLGTLQAQVWSSICRVRYELADPWPTGV